MGDDGNAAGQADLAAVGVSRQVEAETLGGGDVRKLRRVDQGDAEALGCHRQRGRRRGARVEIVHVVGARQVDRVPCPFDGLALVHQHGDPQPFEFVHHGRIIVVAQDADDAVPGADGRHQVGHARQDLFERALDPEAVVAGQHTEVHFLRGGMGVRGIHGAGEPVHVQVGQVQDGEAVEGLRQVREDEVQPGQADVERVADAAAIEADQLQSQPEGGDGQLEQLPPVAAVRAFGAEPVAAGLHFQPPAAPGVARCIGCMHGRTLARDS